MIRRPPRSTLFPYTSLAHVFPIPHLRHDHITPYSLEFVNVNHQIRLPRIFLVKDHTYPITHRELAHDLMILGRFVAIIAYRIASIGWQKNHNRVIGTLTSQSIDGTIALQTHFLEAFTISLHTIKLILFTVAGKQKQGNQRKNTYQFWLHICMNV